MELFTYNKNLCLTIIPKPLKVILIRIIGHVPSGGRKEQI
jgi:hypothetical protein